MQQRALDVVRPILRLSLLLRLTGLAMTMNIQQDEYVAEAGDTAGVVVVIQPQNQMPFPEDDGTLVSPGHATSIAVVQVTTLRHFRHLQL